MCIWGDPSPILAIHGDSRDTAILEGYSTCNNLKDKYQILPDIVDYLGLHRLFLMRMFNKIACSTGNAWLLMKHNFNGVKKLGILN